MKVQKLEVIHRLKTIQGGAGPAILQAPRYEMDAHEGGVDVVYKDQILTVPWSNVACVVRAAKAKK